MDFQRKSGHRINPDIPLAPTQHGIRSIHSTNTLLTKLTQDMTEGFNHKIPHKMTLLIAIEISKTFDATSRHILTDKIYNTGKDGSPTTCRECRNT